MATPEEIEIFKEALRTWGSEVQARMLIEEMAELTVAFCKVWRIPYASEETDEGRAKLEKALERVEEELVDVGVMHDQMALIFDPEKLAAIRRAKIERLKRLVQAEQARRETALTALREKRGGPNA